MSDARILGIGVVGLGYIGRVHVRAWQALRAQGLACRLVAVADSNQERLSGKVAVKGNLRVARDSEWLFDRREVRATPSFDALLDDPEVAIVSLCTPTDTHVAYALRALAAGKHVLVEKPVAVASRDVERLRDAARDARTLCMPALCMRFWPGWDWLRERIHDGSYGAVKSAVFQRLGTRPTWSSFYADPDRTGGALVDLHVHDADFVRWCFGDPREVVSTGTLDHVTTLYRFADGPPHVVAEGGWDHAAGFAFRMRFVVAFEEATADFDLAREPALRLARGRTNEAVALAPANAYEGQARHLVEAVLSGQTYLRATLDDALAVARLLEAERESLVSGRPVVVSARTRS